MNTERPLERKIVTVVFADVVGFTSLSEELDPEDVSTVQEAYFAAVRETVGRYGGRLEKFIGDAAMAVFGVPRTQDDDAERAVRAALALAGAMEQIGVDLAFPDGALRLRVGVNTGEVAVHPESGPEEGMVTGDAVNVAARLQAAAPPGGVVVGEGTALAVADSIELEALGKLELKGKAEGVPAWRATAALAVQSRDRAMGSLRAPILGRERELDLLLSALERVAAGPSERWLIEAAPGVGKTRLIDEFAASARDRDVPVWRARLRPDVVGPYQPVGQLIISALAMAEAWPASSADGADRRGAVREALVGRLETSGLSSARAEVVVDETLGVIWPEAAGRADSNDGGPDRTARFAAWLEGLDALSGEGTTVWLVEDVHWAGGDFLAFLDVATGAAGSRLIVTTTRPSLLERAEAWCADAPEERRHTLHLPQLSAPDAGKLARALVGAAIEPGLVDRIVAASDGNPLFIEELLRTWVSVGLLVREGDAWRLAESAAEVRLPSTVQSIYAAQIDDLPSAARQAARRASVAGRRFPFDSLGPLQVSDAGEAIETLRLRALVSGPEADPLTGATYSYRHALLRDAGYASLARAERARLHVRLARWIESVSDGRTAAVAEVVAGHYAAALEAAPALAREIGDGLGREEAAHTAAAWFELAGAAALSLAAHEAARDLFRRAIDLTAEAETLDLARRWERLGDATAFAADMEEGSVMLRSSIALYRAGMNDLERSEEERGSARSGLARATGTLGWALDQQLLFDDALSLADVTLTEIGSADDAPTGTLLLLRAVQTMNTTDEIDGPESDLRRALDIARAVGDRDLELDASDWLTKVRADRGEDVASEWEGLYEFALREGRWRKAVEVLRMCAIELIDDRAARSWEIVDRAAELADAHGLTEQVVWLEYERTEAGLVSGEWDRALESGLRAIDVGERNAYHRCVVRTWFALIPILQARGMQELLVRAHRWFEDHQPPASAAWQLMMVAGAELRFADVELMPSFVPAPEPRLPAFSEGQGRPSWFAAVERVVTSWLEDGRLDAVRVALDSTAAMPRLPVLGNGIERLLRARLVAAEGAVSESFAAAREAAEAFRAVAAPWWIARSIGFLAEGGVASPGELAEAAHIHQDLRLVGPAE